MRMAFDNSAWSVGAWKRERHDYAVVIMVNRADLGVASPKQGRLTDAKGLC